jgi:hypothetical protein
MAVPPDPEVYRTLHQHHHNNQNYNQHKQLMPKHPPQATLSSNSSKCRLCNNQHPNPWHTTDNCPFKDPTFTQNKLIWENVMQHNSLHGRINKKYSKDTDTSIPSLHPSLKHPPKTTKVADLQLPALDHHSTDTPSPEPIPEYPYHPIPDDSNQHDDSFLDPQNFEVPSLTAHRGTTTYYPPSTDDDDHDHSGLPFDPLQYLRYSSCLSTASPSLYTTIDVSIEHNDGGANCFITNNK